MTTRAQAGLFTAVALAGHRLVAAGEQGRILFSDDNGKSWKQASVPVQVTLTSVAFATPKLGWAAGQMGVVLRTTDGAQSWTRIFDGNAANQLLLDTAKADAAAQPASAVATANLQAAQQMMSGGASVPFLTILPMSTSRILLAGGFGMAFSSTDGGNHWTSLFDAIPNPNGMNIYSLLPDGNATYLIGEQAFVARLDANLKYTTLPAPAKGTLFGGLAIGGSGLLLYGLEGTVLLSPDAGANWQPISSGVTAGIDAGIILKNNDIVLGDVNGDLLVSKDGGHNFTSMPAGQPVAGLAKAPDGAVIIAGPAGLRRISDIFFSESVIN